MTALRNLGILASAGVLSLLVGCSPSGTGGAVPPFPIRVVDDPNGWGVLVVDDATGCEYIGITRDGGSTIVPRTDVGPNAKQRGCRMF